MRREWGKGERLEEDERKTLREEARAAFGGHPIKGARFSFEIDAFRAAVARDTGDLLHLPVEGGMFEQPTRALEIVLILQEEWRRVIAGKGGKR
jgi:hypothetical protein